MTDRQLFRCLAVRNAQRTTSWRNRRSFIGNPDGLSPVTPFQSKVRGLAIASEIRAAAAAFIEEQGYPSGQPYPESVYVFAELYAGIGAAIRAKTAPDEVRKRVARLVARQVPDLSRDNTLPHTRALWDHLIAFFHAPALAREDPGLFVDALRVIHLWENAAQIDGADALTELFQATPVIPRWAVASEATSATDGGQAPDDAAGSGDLNDLLDGLNGHLIDIQAIDAALTDVHNSYRRKRRRTPPAPTRASPPAGRGDAVATPIPGDTVAAPWRSNVYFADELQAASADLLDTRVPEWKSMSQDELVGALEAQQADLAATAYALGGTRALQASEPLALGDFMSIPGVLIEPKQSFDAPYAGSKGSVHSGGIGDLLVVTDTLLGYELGEIAYVENVMQSETRERVHRTLDRTLESITTETAESSEASRDLQTTDRFSLQREVQDTIQSDSSFEVGVDISAQYGPVVSADLSTDFAISNSMTSSETSATEYAQDVVDRAATKVTESTRTEVVTKKLLELEERNSHGFDNANGTGHIVGVYRWLNNLWEAQVWNYGRRALLEFIVPEPARYQRMAAEFGRTQDLDLEPPEPLGDLTPEDITPSSYAVYLGLYHPQGAKAPPDKFRYLSTTLEFPDKGPGVSGLLTDVKKGSVQIPEGYKAVEAYVSASVVGTPGATVVSIVIGDKTGVPSPSLALELSGDTGQLDFAAYIFAVSLAIVAVEIRCERTQEAYEQWQADTYEAIVAAYNAELDSYNAKVASIEAGAAATSDAMPPEKKRAIEQVELKKGALTLLTGQHFADAGSVTGPEATISGLPEIRLEETATEGDYIQFFEQAFEWDQMLYAFYPYFWGEKAGWLETSGAEDTDATFEAFLKAGAARVQVPVRPGYEKALYNFIKTGVIWNGGSAPLVEDDLYISIIEELVAARGITWQDPRAYGPPWTYALPTELVMLQADAVLPTWPSPSGS